MPELTSRGLQAINLHKKGKIMIKNITKNCMGTVSFDGLFTGMRKAQDFIVYPVKDDGHAMTNAKIQSDKRSGFININTGNVVILEGAYFTGSVKATDKLDAEELLNFKAAIFATASAKAGSNGIIHTDNSGAINVFA
jgi:hypothetical protein